jgi:hypothetical protein
MKAGEVAEELGELAPPERGDHEPVSPGALAPEQEEAANRIAREPLRHALLASSGRV